MMVIVIIIKYNTFKMWKSKVDFKNIINILILFTFSI